MKWKRNKSIIRYLKKQGIQGVKEQSTEYEIIKQVREYYKKNTFEKNDLNSKLIVLKNESLDGKKTLDITSEYSMFIAIIICGISLIGGKLTLDVVMTIRIYVVILIVLIFMMISIKCFEKYIYINENSAINIHKSVIKEKIKEIEENEKQKEEVDETNKDLKEIQNILNGTKRETETLRRVFETKIYT